MNVPDNPFDALPYRSFVQRYALLVLIPVVLFIAGTALVRAQQTSLLPKNAKEIVRERERLTAERRRITASSIYSITRTRHQYRFGKIDGKGMTESVTRYDRTGNIAEEILYNAVDGSVQQRTTYRYDSRGNIIEENLFKDDNIFKTVHRHTGANNKNETVIYKSDGTIDKKISYIYDGHGLLLESIGYLSDGRLFLRESMVYDRRGNIAEMKNSQAFLSYRYDENNNVTTIHKFNRMFAVGDSMRYVPSDRYEFSYDRSDNLLSMYQFAPDSSLRMHITYMYDSNGRLTEEKEYNQDQRIVYHRRIVLDKNGEPLEETGSDRGRKFRMKHTYDQRGHKVEMTEFDQINEPKYTIKFSYGRYGAKKPQKKPDPVETLDSLIADLNEPLESEEFEDLLGGRLVAPDGAFLGLVIADTSDSQSIINSWGQYGFSDSPTSIFNPTIPYGGREGIFSPFNPVSPSPPSIYKEGKFYAYFTENPNFRPRSSPKRLLAFLRMLAMR